MKISKILRIKAQEFLLNRKFSDNLLDIMKHFDSGMDTNACLLTLEFIFTNVLKNGDMHIEVTPLKLFEHTVEHQYRQWLRNLYEETWNKLLACYETASAKIQIQGKLRLFKKRDIKYFL